MSSNRGVVEKIASSGILWDEMSTDIRSLFFESLKSARTSITISAFSMGHENEDVIEFFKISVRPEKLFKSPSTCCSVLFDTKCFPHLFPVIMSGT